MQNKFSMSFNKPAGCDNTLNLIQIDIQISQKMNTEVFDFSRLCDLEDQDHQNQYQNVEISGL